MSKDNCKLRYAKSYILLQTYENFFQLTEGFERGTIFKDLYRPYNEKVRVIC